MSEQSMWHNENTISFTSQELLSDPIQVWRDTRIKSSLNFGQVITDGVLLFCAKYRRYERWLDEGFKAHDNLWSFWKRDDDQSHHLTSVSRSWSLRTFKELDHLDRRENGSIRSQSGIAQNSEDPWRYERQMKINVKGDSTIWHGKWEGYSQESKYNRKENVKLQDLRG